jgi:WD40 repeat protein
MMLAGKPHYDYSAHKDVIRGLAFSPDDTRFAISSWDRKVGIWSATDGKQLHFIQAGAGAARLAAPTQSRHAATEMHPA